MGGARRPLCRPHAGTPARPPARGSAGQAQAGGPAGGRAGDGTKAPLLSGGRRTVTHNGGGSRLRRRRRRARRGALPSRPAGAPRTRHTHSRDFSGSSRECGARVQPPMSAQVSGCGGGSGVSEALALPQSPPCNPDPRERARERGRGIHERRPLASQAHSTGSPASARPRALHAPEFPTLVTGFRALRGRQEMHAISSAASGGLGWAGGWLGGGQTGPLAFSLATSPQHKVTKVLASVYCAPTTGKPLGRPRGMSLRPCA